MKRKIKLWIKGRINRRRVSFRNMRRRLGANFDPSQPLDETQKLAMDIVRKAIFHNGSNLVIAPISGTKYIHYDEVFIKIESGVITIINGTYTYHIQIPNKYVYDLSEKYDFRLESIRKRWEAQITAKTKRSLTNILEDLNKK